MSQSTTITNTQAFFSKGQQRLSRLMTKIRFPFYKQLDAMDCGPTCLRMVAKYHGQSYSLQFMREKAFVNREGVSLLSLAETAEEIGLRSLAVRIPVDKLDEMPLPCLAHWRQNHFVVIYKVTTNKVYVADPAHGLLSYTQEAFVEGWTHKTQDEGVLLLLEQTPAFYQSEVNRVAVNQVGFKFIFLYLKTHTTALIRLILLMVMGSMIQLIFPFLTQAVVDRGIGTQDLGFIGLILAAQMMLYVGQSGSDFFSGRILLYVGTRINISIISDFLTKLMALPLSYFESKKIGDILQRINDHHRIETFLTSTTIGIIFSVVNLLTFGLVLFIYSQTVFFIFVIGALIYGLWVSFFIKKRRDLDYKRFSQLSENQSTLIQLIKGMPEIKLNTSEQQKRWEWQQIQENLFQIQMSSLNINQYQQGGARFINQLSNIFILYIVARQVVAGQMSLGQMMAIQFIVGQLSVPVAQMLTYVRATQDAMIGLERLGEIHDQDDEETTESKITRLPDDKSLSINGLDFQYDGPHSAYALKDITLQIPAGKVTAIVGSSGSGKTTLLKLLLKFYQPTTGQIKLGDYDLHEVSSKAWRQKCGAVMQDGYLFADTIARNIALADETVNQGKLLAAAETANIHEFIEALPLAYHTKIGADGHNLSQGQKQRILIARAIYKNPDYLLFDEATNALDASNEKEIMENLESFLTGKTVFVIAHRLSTVQNADQIVMLKQGHIVEQGTHQALIDLQGDYYRLVKNQLALNA